MDADTKPFACSGLTAFVTQPRAGIIFKPRQKSLTQALKKGEMCPALFYRQFLKNQPVKSDATTGWSTWVKAVPPKKKLVQEYRSNLPHIF